MKKRGQVMGIILIFVAFGIVWFCLGIWLGIIIHAKRIVGC